MCRYIIDKKSPRLRDSHKPSAPLFTTARFSQILGRIDPPSQALYAVSEKQQATRSHDGLYHLWEDHSHCHLPFLRLKVCNGANLLSFPQHSLLTRVLIELWRSANIAEAMAGCQYRARNSPAGKLNSHRSEDGDKYKGVQHPLLVASRALVDTTSEDLWFSIIWRGRRPSACGSMV